MSPSLILSQHLAAIYMHPSRLQRMHPRRTSLARANQWVDILASNPLIASRPFHHAHSKHKTFDLTRSLASPHARLSPPPRLTLVGSGFSADTYTGSNLVFIGPYPCNVVGYLTSTSVITCENNIKPPHPHTHILTLPVPTLSLSLAR